MTVVRPDVKCHGSDGCPIGTLNATVYEWIPECMFCRAVTSVQSFKFSKNQFLSSRFGTKWPLSRFCLQKEHSRPLYRL